MKKAAEAKGGDKMSHETRCERAKELIDFVFGGRSVPKEETVAALRDIIEHCKVLVDSFGLGD